MICGTSKYWFVCPLSSLLGPFEKITDVFVKVALILLVRDTPPSAPSICQIKSKRLILTESEQTSTVGIVINVNLIWYYCIRRGIGVDPHVFRFCDHW